MLFTDYKMNIHACMTYSFLTVLPMLHFFLNIIRVLLDQLSSSHVPIAGQFGTWLKS